MSCLPTAATIGDSRGSVVSLELHRWLVSWLLPAATTEDSRGTVILGGLCRRWTCGLVILLPPAATREDSRSTFVLEGWLPPAATSEDSRGTVVLEGHYRWLHSRLAIWLFLAATSDTVVLGGCCR